MIKTFLIYSLLDKCINVLFERIAVIVNPINCYRVGDYFNQLTTSYPLDGNNFNGMLYATKSFYNCEIVHISNLSEIIKVNTESSKWIYTFNNVDNAQKYMDIMTGGRGIPYGDYVTISNCTVSCYIRESTQMWPLQNFNNFEKIK
jgi:hypothetical protein